MSTTNGQQGPGSFISQKKARQMIKAYFRYRQELEQTHQLPWNPQKDHYAYAFGLEQMKTMIQQIEAYNANDPQFPVVGVRVYNTRTLPPEEPGDDVLLIPYLSNNKNLVAIDDDLDNEGQPILDPSDDDGDALNNPLFCPPSCQ